MAGIYIHIPFCKSRCIYCGFCSTTSLGLRQRYVDAVCKEMSQRRAESPFWNHIDTVYVGGGTPSQLTPSQLHQLFATLHQTFQIGSVSTPYPPSPPPEEGPGLCTDASASGIDASSSSSSLFPYPTSPPLGEGPGVGIAGVGIAVVGELTLELNPDDVTPTFARHLSGLPVNRVSMGAQTFDDARLRFLRRRHTASQVRTACDRLRQAGIGNISIDLMYGFPGETLADWQRDVTAALALKAEHLSAYCLMYEEGTPLYRRLAAEGEGWKTDEEEERRMYELLIDRLTAAGYEHYEISNFAMLAAAGRGSGTRPSWRSRHNSSYWTDVPYLGLGAAAHSYDRQTRRWNTSDVMAYIVGIEQGRPAFGYEVLDDATRYNDRVMLSLRTCEGIDTGMLAPADRDYLLSQAGRFIAAGLLRLSGTRLQLTREGLFVSDMVTSELMRV